MTIDRGEPTSMMEPLLIGEASRSRGELADLALELAQRSARFRGGLPPAMIEPLADLVRSMNCYYSNLIEGHDTHPIEIERALRGDYSRDRRQLICNSRPWRTSRFSDGLTRAD